MPTFFFPKDTMSTFKLVLAAAVAVAMLASPTHANQAIAKAHYGSWTFYDVTDNMDDHHWFVASSMAADQRSGIRLECDPKYKEELWFTLTAPDYLGAGGRSAIYRIDSNPPVTVERASYGKKQLVFGGNDVPDFRGGSVMQFRLWTYDFEQREYSVPINGAAEAEKEVMDDCRVARAAMIKAAAPPMTAQKEAAQKEAERRTAEKAEAEQREAANKAVREAKDKATLERMLHSSNDTAGLTGTQRGAIGDYVRRCWSTDPRMLDLDKMEVLLTVTIDGSGVVRRAIVAPDDAARVGGNPRLRMFSERAVRTVLDPNCANLPLPQPMLGHMSVITFRFRP